jgi:hypothetical protein
MPSIETGAQDDTVSASINCFVGSLEIKFGKKKDYRSINKHPYQ